MTKQEWLIIKKEPDKFPMELYYKFYKIHNQREGEEMTPEEFRGDFQFYVLQIGNIPVKRIIEYYDNEFMITKLIDKYGKVIKEY